VGHSASAGVIFRTGLSLIAGERVASGLILTFGSFDCVLDNASCFTGGTFPNEGSIMHFGKHRVYVASIVETFPHEVVTVFGAPPGFAASRIASGNVEVMMAGSGENRRPPLERNGESRAANSRLSNQDLLDASIEHLRNPITPIEVNPAAAAAGLEATRQSLLEEAGKVAAAQRRMNATMREYNIVHDFARLPGTSRLAQPQG